MNQIYGYTVVATPLSIFRKIRNSPHRKNRQLSTGNETIFLASYFTNYIRHCLE